MNVQNVGSEGFWNDFCLFDDTFSSMKRNWILALILK